jgi:perosamine synthetase
VVEDAAQAHGVRYRGRPAGSLGRVAAFSLYGNKTVTSGEGGVVTTDDEGIAMVARELRDHAFSPERHFWHRRPGFNYRMTNLQAAIGLAQVERLDELVARRVKNDRRYREALAGIDGIGLPPDLDGAVTWMFGVTVDERFGISRDELRRRLAGRGVETRTFFVPLHLQPVLRRRFAGQRYPVAERLGRSGLYLPSGPGLTADDVAYVAEGVRAAMAADRSSSQ